MSAVEKLLDEWEREGRFPYDPNVLVRLRAAVEADQREGREGVKVEAYHCGECQCVKMTERLPWVTRHTGVVELLVAPTQESPRE